MNIDADALALIRAAAVEAKRNGRGPGSLLPRLVDVLPEGSGLTLDFGGSAELGGALVILRPTDRHDPAFDLLTRREREVAALLAKGLRNREIAEALDISIGTVKDHVHHVLAKSGLESRTAVAARWVARARTDGTAERQHSPRSRGASAESGGPVQRRQRRTGPR